MNLYEWAALELDLSGTLSGKKSNSIGGWVASEVTTDEQFNLLNTIEGSNLQERNPADFRMFCMFVALATEEDKP